MLPSIFPAFPERGEFDIYATMNPAKEVGGQFNFVNAGHELPFIAAGGQPFAPHKIRAGFVLAGMEGVRYRCGSLKISPGDKLFQYTDGVTEATDKDNRLYGMERLEQVLAENTRQSPRSCSPPSRQTSTPLWGTPPSLTTLPCCAWNFGIIWRRKLRKSGDESFSIIEPQQISIWEELRKEAPPKLFCHFPGRTRVCPG